MRGLRALSVAAVVAVLVAAFVWLAVMLGLGVLFIAGLSGPRSVESFAPLVLLVLGVAMLVLLVRAEWWSRGWRKIVVAVQSRWSRLVTAG